MQDRAATFVLWYKHDHCRSNIDYVSPFNGMQARTWRS